MARFFCILADDCRFKIFTLLQRHPDLSQCGLARPLGISLGKANFCLKALKNTNKLGYLYLLTPKGIEEKTLLTCRFLNIKLEGYEKLTAETESLREEALSETEGND